jgi:hypothetical protein
MENSNDLRGPLTAVQGAMEVFMRAMARRYIWWQSPDEALRNPNRLIVQVMDIGTFEDAQELQEIFGNEPLRVALRSAGPGQLRGKSWSYWHYRLDITPINQAPPPMPIRTFA